ncbi:MAG: TPM domain-containing protein [Gemmataceae bacterium]
MSALSWRRPLFGVPLGIALCLLAPTVRAGDDIEVIVPPARAVRDHVDIFSAEAKTKANATVAKIRTLFKTDLIVETLKAPKFDVDATDPAAVHKAYMTWLQKHAKDLMGTKGILVAMFPGENKVFCLVGPATQKEKIMSAASAAGLDKKVQPKLADKKYDDALAETMKYVIAALPPAPAEWVKTDSETWFGMRDEEEEGEAEIVAPPPLAVRDKAGVFGAEARARANKLIGEIKDKYGTTMIVEATKAPELPGTVDATDKTAVNAFYEKTLKDHAKKLLGTAGIYVAILPDKHEVFCFVGPETQKRKIFSVAKALELPKQVQPKVAKGEFDQALEGTVGFVRAALPPLKGGVKTDSDTWFHRFRGSEESRETPHGFPGALLPVVLWATPEVEAALAVAADEAGEVLDDAKRPIRDDAKIFSPAAVSKASAEIGKIESRHHTPMIIETREAPKLPPDVDHADGKAVHEYYRKTLLEHAKKTMGKAGVFVAILPDKGQAYCFVGPDTINKEHLTPKKATEIALKMQEKVKKKDYDGALDLAVASVRSLLPPPKTEVTKTDSDTWFGRDKKTTTGGGAGGRPVEGHEPAKPTPWLTYILIGLGVIIVLWLIMAVVRGLSGMGGGGGAPGYGSGGPGYAGGYGGGGGGGFMRGFLGGLVGAAAGMWLYNNVFGGGASSAFGGTHSPTGGMSDTGAAAAEPEERATDWGGGGGDDSAGADEGGGGGGGGGGDDAGGGDWGGGGGGDTGGGGDWGGGGGGDWGGGGGGDWGGGGGGDWGGGGGGDW